MDNNRKNLICIIIIIVLALLCAVMFKFFDNKKFWLTDDFEQRIVQYNEKAAQEKAKNAEAKARREAILEKTPGIACWGDGFTYGTYGSGTNYPSALEGFLESEDYPYEVSNMGVFGENSLTVLGRTGAVPFVVAEDFTVSGTGEDLIEVKITSEDGQSVNPCMQDVNPGFNPCVVNGVKCTIYGETDSSDLTKPKAYYFNREDGKQDDIDISAGTVIETEGSREFGNYINILQIGDGGGYANDNELAGQFESFAEYFGKDGKYVILGRIGGSEAQNSALDAQLTQQFGSHYLNIRKLLCTQNIEGVEYTDSDKAEMAQGVVPACLKTENYLNKYGYNAVGKIVFDRLKELGLAEK